MNPQLINTMMIFIFVLTGLFMLNACNSVDKKEPIHTFLKNKLPYALIVSSLYYVYTCVNKSTSLQKINTNSFDDF